MKNTKKYISAILILSTVCGVTGCNTTPKQVTKIEKSEENETEEKSYSYSKLSKSEKTKIYIRNTSSKTEEKPIQEVIQKAETTIKEAETPQKAEYKVDNRTSVGMQNLYMNKSLPYEYQELWNKIMNLYNAGERTAITIENCSLTHDQISDMFSNYIEAISEIRYAKDIKFLTGITSNTESAVSKPQIDFSLLDKAINDSNYIQDNINRAISSIGINSNWKEEDAVIAINNYIVDITDYDYTYSRLTMKNLFEGSVVCHGYANVFQAICSTIGIKCDNVTGIANGGPHAWNRVYIDGTYKYVDCTWNDTTKSNKWLLLSEEEMNKDHTIENVMSIN